MLPIVEIAYLIPVLYIITIFKVISHGVLKKKSEAHVTEIFWKFVVMLTSARNITVCIKPLLWDESADLHWYDIKPSLNTDIITQDNVAHYSEITEGGIWKWPDCSIRFNVMHIYKAKFSKLFCKMKFGSYPSLWWLYTVMVSNKCMYMYIDDIDMTLLLYPSHWIPAILRQPHILTVNSFSSLDH